MREDIPNFAEPLIARVRERLSNRVRDDRALVELDVEYPRRFTTLGGARELILISAEEGSSIFGQGSDPLKVYVGAVHRRGGKVDAEATRIDAWGLLFRSRDEALKLAPRPRT